MTQRHPTLRIVAYVLISVLVGLLVVGVLTVIVQTREVVGVVREQQKASTARGKDIQATAKAIKDCTEPDGECFKRGQRQTADAVADINKISVYAAACADEPGTQTASDIYACVVDRLAEDDKTP